VYQEPTTSAPETTETTVPTTTQLETTVTTLPTTTQPETKQPTFTPAIKDEEYIPAKSYSEGAAPFVNKVYNVTVYRGTTELPDSIESVSVSSSGSPVAVVETTYSGSPVAQIETVLTVPADHETPEETDDTAASGNFESESISSLNSVKSAPSSFSVVKKRME